MKRSTELKIQRAIEIFFWCILVYLLLCGFIWNMFGIFELFNPVQHGQY